MPLQFLDRSIRAALDGLLQALELQPLGNHRFRAQNEPDRFGQIFGGQAIGQALMAAAQTVPDKTPHSLHAYFVQTGGFDQPLDISVEPVRDGRSMATRHVRVTQGPRTLLVALVSFHDHPAEPELAAPPDVPRPDQTPLLQEWAANAPPELRPQVRNWIDAPPPLEMRIGEPTFFLGGRRAGGPRSHWMRLPRSVGDDPLLHRALLVYASDYLLLDMALRSHPGPLANGKFAAFSLDHSIWLHRPVRFDDWHLYTQETVAISGQRGLVRGAIHDSSGQLVASIGQEVLIRPR